MNVVSDRIYIKGTLKSNSPFVFGSYENENTDITSIRDSNGNPYIPGSSLGGALKTLFYNDNSSNKILNSFFGYEDKDKNDFRQSMLITYDCFLCRGCTPSYSIRDGIRISKDRKITEEKAKYDYEVIEAGCEFDFKLELLIRKNDSKNEYIKILNTSLDFLKKGIFLGSKTSRGLGSFSLSDISIYEIGENDYKKYVDFSWESKDFASYEDSLLIKKGLHKANNKQKTIKLIAKFPNTLLIRNYFSPNEVADCAMITSNGKPIIPGTSWAGLFRNSAEKILDELGCKNSEKFVEEIFGSNPNVLKENEKKASNIVFSESVIENCKSFVQQNVRIDRFTQGAVDKALFNAKVIATFETELIITLRYPENWIIDLLGLIVLDINDAYLAIGGQTAIGRGIFNLYGFEKTDFRELYKKLKTI